MSRRTEKGGTGYGLALLMLRQFYASKFLSEHYGSLCADQNARLVCQACVFKAELMHLEEPDSDGEDESENEPESLPPPRGVSTRSRTVKEQSSSVENNGEVEEITETDLADSNESSDDVIEVEDEVFTDTVNAERTKNNENSSDDMRQKKIRSNTQNNKKILDIKPEQQAASRKHKAANEQSETADASTKAGTHKSTNDSPPPAQIKKLDSSRNNSSAKKSKKVQITTPAASATTPSTSSSEKKRRAKKIQVNFRKPKHPKRK